MSAINIEDVKRNRQMLESVTDCRQVMLTFDVLALLKSWEALADFVTKLPSTHRSWPTCVCEHCPKIRALLGVKYPGE